MITSVLIHLFTDSIRNYAILHIVAEEAKIFQTKERAPLLLCLEAYRPEELTLLQPKKVPIGRKSITEELPLTDNIIRRNSRSSSFHQGNAGRYTLAPFLETKNNNLQNPYLSSRKMSTKKAKLPTIMQGVEDRISGKIKNSNKNMVYISSYNI